MKDPRKKYFIDASAYYTDFDDHYSHSKKYGGFARDGKSYEITAYDTPRQWLNYLYNDRFVSVVANHGEGFHAYGNLYNRVTRYFDPDLYLIRNLDGRRVLEVVNNETGETQNLLDAQNVRCRVMPGCSEFAGSGSGLEFRVRIFVPLEECCECWLIELKNESDALLSLTVHAAQTWAFHNDYKIRRPCADIKIQKIPNGFFATAEGMGKPFATMYGAFVLEACSNQYAENRSRITRVSASSEPPAFRNFLYKDVHLYAKLNLPAGEPRLLSAAASACDNREEAEECAGRYADARAVQAACEKGKSYRERLAQYNTCRLPDPNMERFLNIWLKNQVGLTYRYNRACDNAGFRDLLQDAWGSMLIRPDYPKRRLIEVLSHVYADGHSMRSYDSYIDLASPEDYVDCPLWAPNTVAQYVKETGDFGFLSHRIPYFDGEKSGTVEEHLWKMVAYPYEHRGENGLVLMRDGDWLDGLSGINQNGTATSAWATMQAFWAQGILSALYDAAGEKDKADELRRRSAEYRATVRKAAWDGNWYVYGFKSDGFPVGSSRCREGKIYLNPQTWAVLTGIEQDPGRIRSICRSVQTYLTTMFGPCLLYPPYVQDKTCGRISSQMPGSFANGAIYLHAAVFKVYADIMLGDNEAAYDTFMRLLPNHPDNPDSRRTGEPYCTGNFYFGPDSECFGMNLFTWFTATPVWLLHAGFDRILGVEAGYDGLHIAPHVPEKWNSYEVRRLYRGKEYLLSFRRAGKEKKKGIYSNGMFVASHVIPVRSTAAAAEFEILY